MSARRYSPFGQSRGISVGTFGGDHGFVDRVTDSNTRLNALGERQYDPSLGAFISPDPLQDSGNPQQLNGYAYANNNPLTFSDPDGQMLAGFCCGRFGVGAAFAGGFMLSGDSLTVPNG